ncbi:hypothetical protein F9K94_21340 [Brucella tritici]|uniref:Uncharacterized protein n=1 Tax=Brucella tritici TaxID=94626 RepID=A0A7V8B0T2_9HYPH|nr:hypothetical protein [Brucella tritici]KAB2655104.1 hypothetical protein F9K94_21340 [Brucella tritici]
MNNAKKKPIQIPQQTMKNSTSANAISAGKQNWLLAIPKWLMKMMAAVLKMVNRVLSVFGIGPVGNPHSAAMPKPASSVAESDASPMNELKNEPSMAQMAQLVPVATVAKILEYAKAKPENRKQVDLSQLSMDHKIWLSTLNQAKLDQLATMKPNDALAVVYKGVSELQARKSGILKSDRAAPQEPSMVEAIAEEVRSNPKARRLKDRLEEERKLRKERSAPALRMAMG